MSGRHFIALGTASQVPTRERNHNGYYLRWDQQGFLFDPGEGTQRQMIYANLSVSKIHKIFITHFHGDHCLGLAGIIQRISLDQVEHTVQIYYPESGKEYVHHLRNSSIFYNVAKIEECPFSEEGVIFKDDKITITTKKLDHSVDSWGYRIQEKDSYTFLPEKLKEYGLKGAIVGQLKQNGSVELEGEMITVADVGVVKKGQSMAFVMDTRYCQSAIDLAKEADLLVCESTYLTTEEKDAINNGHLTAKHAAQIASQAQAKRLVLTHFSQRYLEIQPFVDEAQQIHSDVIAVQDGQSVDVPKQK
ncbi:MAG: ribonuclease Z [bacterium]|jgi:ribonuclease Z